MPTWKSKIAGIGIWWERPKVAERRLPLALFICGLLAYGAAFAWHMLTTFDLLNLIRDVNYDDSFYYFQIAYNLAQGKFSTFDGGITQTNGYQPVWLLLITPFYWLFDKETALFGIKAFEIMLVAGGVAVVVAAAWLSRLAWPLLFAALPMLYRYPHQLLGGLETAIAMFTLSLLIIAVCLYMRDPPRWKWHLAALAFALPWVRIEYIAISLAVTAALCAIEWSRQERRSLRLSASANIRHAYIPLIGAIAGMPVYFFYNGLAFGGILPVSAAVKLAWSQTRWAREGGYDFLENIRYMIWLDGAFDYELLIALEICAYLLLVWRLALRSNDRRDWLLVAFLLGVFGLAAGHLAKFAQAVLTVHPGVGNQPWYFVPAYLMTAIIIPVRLYIAILLIRRFIAPRRRIAANALAVGVVIIGAAVLLARAGFAEPFRWVDQKSRSTAIHWATTAYMNVHFMNRALPEGSVIGSWDAGVIGYFSRFPVVNLDGFVNSYAHFRAGAFQHSEGLNFYRRYGVTHFANNRRYDRIPNNAIFEGAPLDPPYDDYRFTLWMYDPAPDAHVEYKAAREANRDSVNMDRFAGRDPIIRSDFDVYIIGDSLIYTKAECDEDDVEARFYASVAPLHTQTLNSGDSQRNYHLIDFNFYDYGAIADDGRCLAAVALPNYPIATIRAGQYAVTADRNDYLWEGAYRVDARMIPLTAYADVDFKDLASRDPIIRSDFEVYLIDGNLIYSKAECDEDDVEAQFYAKVFPVNAKRLPSGARQLGYDGIDFNFYDYGAIADDGRCLAAVALPNYPIVAIHAGQYAEKEDGYSRVWMGKYIDYSQQIWERLEPRFDYSSNGVGVVLTGRTAQAFAKDCPPDEPFIWTWTEPQHERTVRSETVPYRTRANICVDARVLPRGAGHPALAEMRTSSAYTDVDFEQLASREPIIRSNFNIHIIDDSLIFTKSACAQADVKPRFFASVFPVDPNHLPNRNSDYYGIDFDFHDHGAIADDGRCWAAVNLPNYPIAEIHAGQYAKSADGYTHIWVGTYGERSYEAGADAESEKFERLADREPIIRSHFDVYIIGDSLIYAKTDCDEDDVTARFYVSIDPRYADDLPDNRAQSGYDAIEFNFHEYGAIADDGQCWTETSLPNYPIAELRTGQYEEVADGYNYLWESAYRFD